MANSRNGSLVLLLLLIAGIIGLSIYTLKLKSHHEDLHQVHQELQKEFDNQVITIDNLNAKNKELEEALTTERAKINGYKNRIAALLRKDKLSAKEIVSLGKRIGALDDEIEGYKVRVAELEQQIRELQTNNQDLNNKNTLLSEEKEVLQQKVNEAAQVRVVNLTFSAIKKVWFFGEKKKPTTNPEKVSEITLSFFLQNNFLAQDGTKELYMSIIQPDGSVLVDNDLQSNQITFVGNPVNYTQKIVANYDKSLSNKVVTQFSPDNLPMQSGKYEVLVYDHTGTIVSDRSAFYFDLVKDSQ